MTVAVVASLTPSLLPRSAFVQAIVTGLLAVFALALSALIHRLVRPGPRPPRPAVRRCAVLLGVVAISTAAVANDHWQNSVRSAMGTEPTSAFHWIEVSYGAVSVCAAAIVIGVGVVRGVRRPFVAKATVALSISIAAMCIAAGTYTIDITPSTTSEGLGPEGLKFIASGTENGGLRVYSPLGSGRTTTARARSAVDQLEREGGFAKSHIVVAVPTGSGWIDANAVEGWENKYHGDVATVAVQYSSRPSWVTFLFARSQARDSATALIDALAARLESVPDAERPDLHVYGQSLGSIGASEAVRDRTDICGVLWAGPPAGQVARSTRHPSVVLANSSDPVVWWSSDLIGSEPDLTAARTDAPVPQWIPVITYLQTTVDMLSALTTPDGHGHRYGTDQGELLPGC